MRITRDKGRNDEEERNSEKAEQRENKVGGVPLFIGVREHTGVSGPRAGKYNKIMHTGDTAETPVCYFIICMHIGIVENADMHIKK